MITLNDIKALYEKYGVSASKRFGQNFLIDPNVLRKIIEVANVKDKEVLEVGPGLGSLTHLLLEKASKVSSYEIDRDMIMVLKGEIENDNFELIEGDFLKAELNWKGKKTVVANIPYYITSDILFKLYEHSDKIDRAILMMQNEVADRISAPVGSKHYGKLTISTNYFVDVKKEFVVQPNSFLPAPKVKSAVVSLEFKGSEMNKSFLEVVKKCFTMRRKTLFNNLKTMVTPGKANSIIKEMNLKPTARPQELNLEQFIELYKLIKK